MWLFFKTKFSILKKCYQTHRFEKKGNLRSILIVISCVCVRPLKLPSMIYRCASTNLGRGWIVYGLSRTFPHFLKHFRIRRCPLIASFLYIKNIITLIYPLHKFRFLGGVIYTQTSISCQWSCRSCQDTFVHYIAKFTISWLS